MYVFEHSTVSETLKLTLALVWSQEPHVEVFRTLRLIKRDIASFNWQNKFRFFLCDSDEMF